MTNKVPLAAAAVAFLAAFPAAGQTTRILTISPNDYPESVRLGPTLHVRVRYQLGDDGRFTQCEVQRSSGEPRIDDASCQLLRERARFRPEHGMMRGSLQLDWLGEEAIPNANPRGAPIPISLIDELSSEDYPPDALRRNQSGLVNYSVTVSDSGVPRQCTVPETSGSAALDRRTCEIVMERSAFIPASDGAGSHRSGVYHGRIRWVADQDDD